MRSRHILLVATLSTTVALIVAGCAPAGAPAAITRATPTAAATTLPAPQAAEPAATPKAAAQQQRQGGVLTISVGADPPSFDIHQETTIAALEPLVPAYDGLVQYDHHTGSIIGDLAEKWELSPDGLVYTFSLQKGVKWHDGKPFSSSDVRISLERQKDPPKGMRSGHQQQFRSVDRIETPDENTVKVIMKQPYVSFLAQFATDWFVVFPRHVLEAKGDMKKEVMGTGPYRFKSHSLGVSVELTRSPDYFMKGLPYLDGITYYIVKDAGTRFSAFRTGRIKMTSHWIPLTPSEIATLKSQHPSLLLWESSADTFPRHPMNAVKPPFGDTRVRQAVGLAYDRQTAIKVLADGQARLGTFVPPGEWGRPEADVLKLPGYRQPKDADRAEAKRLLAEAGYPEGFKTTLSVRAKSEDQKAGEFLKDQLATIGIAATLEVMEVAAYTSRVVANDFQIGTQAGKFALSDPDELGRYFLSNAGQGYGKWANKRFDDLFAEQSRTVDIARRKAIVKEMDDVLLQELPSLLPFWSGAVIGTWPEVKNFAAPANLHSCMRLFDIWLTK
ncbi:MAG: ABC transporter substrate-binding protein [Chloroflexi bacterium]|nr:ABC transporter substrate-binding protein [Chloroflexota bacterium]